MFRIVLLLLLLALPTTAGAQDFNFASAAQKYEVPENLLRAISKVESEHNNSAVAQNRNGSIDSGHMQINSWWKPHLGKENYLKLTENEEYCTMVGAWILRQCFDRYPKSEQYWDAVSCYNTGRGLKNNLNGNIYAHKIYRALTAKEK